jgi:transcriptional regulator with XRE-family HTH domain
VNDAWRRRLRDAIDRTNKKHSYIAECADIAPVTLSRILTGVCAEPRFTSVVRLAHEAGVTVGWLLNEDAEGGIHVRERDRVELRNVAYFIIRLTGK